MIFVEYARLLQPHLVLPGRVQRPRPADPHDDRGVRWITWFVGTDDTASTFGGVVSVFPVQTAETETRSQSRSARRTSRGSSTSVGEGCPGRRGWSSPVLARSPHRSRTAVLVHRMRPIGAGSAARSEVTDDMDRYDPPDRPSIFSRPDDMELEPRPPSERRHERIEAVEDELTDVGSSRRSGAGWTGSPSRRLVIGLGVTGLLVLVTGGFVAGSLLGPHDDGAIGATSPTESASVTPTSSPSTTHRRRPPRRTPPAQPQLPFCRQIHH